MPSTYENLDPEDARLLAEPIPADIDVVARRELALDTLDIMRDLLDVRVSVPNLIKLSHETEATPVRLGAKRALRCLEAVGREDSIVIRTIGKVGLYDYVEGVMTYGASEQTYLGLVDDYGLSASEVTALYALREMIAEYTNDSKPGFLTLIQALQSIGISPQEAAINTDAALASLDAAGCFVDNSGGVIYDRPIFLPPGVHKRRFSGNADTYYDREADEWLKQRFEKNQSRPGDEEPEE